MSIIDHPCWKAIRPYWCVDPYARDATAKSGPRYRLELRKLPRDLSLRLRQLQQPCVACGNDVHVFRQRKGGDPRTLYFAPSCPEAVSPGCKRGLEASTEYQRVRAELEGNPLPPTQDGLFDPKRSPPPSDPGSQEKRIGDAPIQTGGSKSDPPPKDCILCRRPAICFCEAPRMRHGDCGLPMCESCATTVHHLRPYRFCPKHAAAHFQGGGPLWVRERR